MASITVLGGTGFAGSHIVATAVARGHDVTSVSRKDPGSEQLPGVVHRSADVLDADELGSVVADADVVISALSPRGDLDGRLLAVDHAVADLVAANAARLIVVGGFSSLRPDPDSPRIIETQFDGAVDAPVPGADMQALRREATEMNSILLDLLARPDDLDWVFASPGLEFGAHAPGRATGSYRISDAGIVLTDGTGRSAISGSDFGQAIVDIVDDKLRRGHIAVAY